MNSIETTPQTEDLVPIIEQQLGAETVPAVDARDLHAALEVGRDFSTWLKSRIDEYGFQRDTDYMEFSPKRGKTPQGGRPTIDYYLSLDMAKELAMVENNERGRKVRRYFIEVERRARESAGASKAMGDYMNKQRAIWREAKRKERAALKKGAPDGLAVIDTQHLAAAYEEMHQAMMRVQAWTKQVEEMLGKLRLDILYDVAEMSRQKRDEMQRRLGTKAPLPDTFVRQPGTRMWDCTLNK